MKGTKALIVITALAVAGGCAGGTSPATTTNSAGTPRSAAAPSPSLAEARRTTTVPAPDKAPATTTATPARATATATPSAWATTPITVRNDPPVPPLPVVERIRYAAHRDGFDRIVLDISGGLPGYTVRYVDEVRRDGSDEPVSMPGEAFLMIVLHPAQAHRADGAATVSGIHRTGLAGIKAYAIVGDYEGYVSIALGLNGVRRFHAGELSDRIYVDVAV
ncbi:AMIN-like domain-containing (lipo)protein [Actinoplanes sp. CA-030573]|uniref:AMIN-like domain-containing (lipo)protein n=1 Tax=Actinoplanes sp. CA-030573 TaxID=3239898 RepID=UPI003D9170B0